MKKIIFLLFLLLYLPLYGQFSIDSLIQRVNAVSGMQAKQAVTDAFVDSARSVGIPIIQGNEVIFIYQGNPGYVSLGGDHNNWQGSFKEPLNHIDSTNFHYQIETFESNARFEYAFLVDDVWSRDRENPLVGTRYSILAMPEYEFPWETEVIDSTNKGQVVYTTLNYFADETDKQYKISIYLPYGYDSSKNIKYPVVYFQDGSLYLTYTQAKNVFDNIIHFKISDPVIAVFVDPYNRAEDYLVSQKAFYAEFFATSLVHYIDSVYTTDARADKRLVMGFSYGGNISAYIAYQYADVFANCGLHSAAFRPTFDVYNLITDGEKKDVNFYSVWGSYEYPIPIDMRAFRNKLLDLGYNFTWAEYPEGHNFGFWKAHIKDIIAHFFPYGEVNELEKTHQPETFILKQNYPNPFNPRTNIEYSVRAQNSVPQQINLSIYNLLGQKVATLVDKRQTAGQYQVTFNASGMASGIYYYKLLVRSLAESGRQYVQTRKMLLLK